MTTKQYSKPELITVGDAVEVTLYRYRGYYRDNRWYRYYYRPRYYQD